MTDWIIDISDEPAALNVRNNLLVIKTNGNEVTVPFVDIAVLAVANPAVHFTQAVLSNLCRCRGIFIVCNEKRMPTGMILPLEGHFLQAERFAAQVKIALPTMKKLWKQIVKAKIISQANLLVSISGSDNGLFNLAKKVKSGDTTNIEAHAARRYWLQLFGHDFKRDFEAEDQNQLLNYGYAVLRAITTRAICAAGLHPSLGIHHHNRYNLFCLADDLMEPFRPVVDRAVFNIASNEELNSSLNKNTKSILIKSLCDRRYNYNEDSRTLFDVMTRIASSLVAIYTGEKQNLIMPRL